MTLTFTACTRRRRLASRRPATTPDEAARAIVLVSAFVPVLVVVVLGVASLLR